MNQVTIPTLVILILIVFSLIYFKFNGNSGGKVKHQMHPGSGKARIVEGVDMLTAQDVVDAAVNKAASLPYPNQNELSLSPRHFDPIANARAAERMNWFRIRGPNPNLTYHENKKKAGIWKASAAPYGDIDILISQLETGRVDPLHPN